MISEFLGAALNFRKRQKICRTLYMSSKKHEIRHFHIAVVQWWQRNVPNSVLNLRSFFLLNKPYYLFKHSVVMAVVIAKGAECYCFYFQPTFHTIEDIYEVQLDTDRGVKEKIRIFDTAGLVSELLIMTFQPAAKCRNLKKNFDLKE